MSRNRLPPPLPSTFGERIDDLPGSLHRLAQNDHMIDGDYLPDGLILLFAANRIKALEAEAERLRSAITLYVARTGGMTTGTRWTSQNTHELNDLLAALNTEEEADASH